MTTYGAYDAGLPCKNTACKSHGKPHPNCRCYGDMAKGGEASFCSEDRAHNKDCEYYADGGLAEIPEGFEEKAAPPTSDIPEGFEEKSSVEIPEGFEEKSEDPNKEKYSGVGSQIASGVEGLAQGFAGPVATAAEKGLNKIGVPGFSDEDITGRAEANPWTHGIGEAVGFGTSMATGVGEVALASKLATKVVPKSIPVLGKIGAKLLQGFVANSTIGAANETSKALLGQVDADPKYAVSDFILHSSIAGVLGMGGALAGEAVTAAMEAKLGSRALSALAGFGAKAEGLSKEAGSELGLVERDLYHAASFKSAYNNYEKFLEKGVKAAVDWVGIHEGGLSGLAIAKLIDPIVETVLRKPIRAASDYVTPAITKWLSEGAPSQLVPIIDYATKIAKGNKLANSAINGLFTAGAIECPKNINTKGILEWLDDGGITNDIQQESGGQESQGFAKGGDVGKKPQAEGILHNHPVATLYPEQNILLQAAKGRVSNYLTGLKPQKNMPKLVFDKEPDQKEKQKIFDRALDIAANPLSVLEKIKNGTVLPEHIQHLNALYPEVSDVLKQRITKRITEEQLKGDKPNFRVRQGLSLLMGAPLSGEFLPQNIMAAQATFLGKKQQQQQGAPAPSKDTAKLSKSSQTLMTGNQSLVGRSQRQA